MITVSSFKVDFEDGEVSIDYYIDFSENHRTFTTRLQELEDWAVSNELCGLIEEDNSNHKINIPFEVFLERLENETVNDFLKYNLGIQYFKKNNYFFRFIAELNNLKTEVNIIGDTFKNVYYTLNSSPPRDLGLPQKFRTSEATFNNALSKAFNI